MSRARAIPVEGAPADSAALVLALRTTLAGLVVDIEALRRVLEAAPQLPVDQPFFSVADAALERMAALCDAATQVAGGAAYGGEVGGAGFLNAWCVPKALHRHVSAMVEGGAA